MALDIVKSCRLTEVDMVWTELKFLFIVYYYTTDYVTILRDNDVI